MNETQQHSSTPVRCVAPIDHYRKDAETYDYFADPDAITAEYWERLRSAVAARIPTDKEARILDVGSGSGWLARKLMKRGAHIVSLDLSEKSLARVREETGSDVVVSPAERLPFADATFDCVVASEVVEHVNNPGAAIAEFFRVTKSGGRVIVSTPYRERIQWSLCVHCNKPTPLNAHLHSFDEHSLGALFTSVGAHQVRFRRIGNKAFVRLRASYVLRALPLRAWLALDGVANTLLPKPLNIIMYGEK